MKNRVGVIDERIKKGRADNRRTIQERERKNNEGESRQ